MLSKKAATEKFRILDVVRVLKYKIKFAVEHPDYFGPDGLLCFVGAQGSGKTLSAVNYVYKLLEMYPECILVTNVNLSDYPIVLFEDYKLANKKLCNAVYDNCLSCVNIDEESDLCEEERQKVVELADSIMYSFYLHENRVFLFSDNDDLSRYSNDQRGVIFLIDEIQLYMNSLKSHNINMDVMTQISQQRKQRKHIVATSQVFGRMAKPLREQFSSVIVCKSIMGCIQYNMLIDRDDIAESSDDAHIKGTCKHRFIWTHKPSMYKKYDTYYVIEKGKFASGEERKGDIYENDNSVGLSNGD